MASESRWQTFPDVIATGTQSDVTVYTPDAGKRFEVAYIIFNSVGGTCNVTYKSGSTALSGAFPTVSGGTFQPAFNSRESPIFVGRVKDEVFVMDKTGVGALVGWFSVRSAQ